MSTTEPLSSRLPENRGVERDPSQTAATSAGVPCITQETLARYCELRDLAQKCRELRVQIIGLFDAGAKVEPGPLTAQISEREARAFSAAKLQALFGEVWVSRTKSQIPPTLSQYLLVQRRTEQVDDFGGHSSTGWGMPPTNPRRSGKATSRTANQVVAVAKLPLL